MKRDHELASVMGGKFSDPMCFRIHRPFLLGHGWQLRITSESRTRHGFGMRLAAGAP